MTAKDWRRAKEVLTAISAPSPICPKCKRNDAVESVLTENIFMCARCNEAFTRNSTAKSMIGRLEETFLAALVGLGGESYSVAIHDHVQQHTGRSYSPGAILTTLYRMEEKGFISSRYSEPTPERGGRRKRMFKIENPGNLVLDEASRIKKTLSA